MDEIKTDGNGERRGRERERKSGGRSEVREKRGGEGREEKERNLEIKKEKERGRERYIDR